MKKNHRHAKVARFQFNTHTPRPKCYRCGKPLADNLNEVEVCLGCADKVR